MPRPRILGSPRSTPRKANRSEEATPKVVTISDYEEPDCEIIKIEEQEEEEGEENHQDSPVRVEVRGVAEYRGAKLLPSLLSLQLVPSGSTKFSGGGGQNVVMVMPMVADHSSRVFNPTLCRVEKIENPTEITQIQRVVGMQRNAADAARGEKRSRESREKLVQTIFRHNSAENQRIGRENRLVGNRGNVETAKNPENRRLVNENRSNVETTENPENRQIVNENRGSVETTKNQESRRIVSENRVVGIRENVETAKNLENRRMVNENRVVENRENVETAKNRESRRIVSEKRGNRGSVETARNPENRRLVNENRIIGIRKTAENSELRAKTEPKDDDDDNDRQESTAVFFDSAEGPRKSSPPEQKVKDEGESISSVEKIKDEGESSSTEEKFEDEDESRSRGLESLLAELPDTSNSESATDESFSPRRRWYKTGREQPRISSLENSPANEGAATTSTSNSAREKSCDSSHERRRLNFCTEEPRGSPKIREISTPLIGLQLKIDAKTNSRVSQAKNRSENDRPIFLVEESASIENSRLKIDAKTTSKSPNSKNRSDDDPPIFQIAKSTIADNSRLKIDAKTTSKAPRSKNRSDENQPIFQIVKSAITKESRLKIDAKTTSKAPNSKNRSNEDQPIFQIEKTAIPKNSQENRESPKTPLDKKSHAEEKSSSSQSQNREKTCWKLRCIGCGRRFADRNELHRHATLAHPGVQILFCELCSDSFLSHAGLEAHRAEKCGAEIAVITETIVIDDDDDDEEDFGRSGSEKLATSGSEKSATSGSEKSATSGSEKSAPKIAEKSAPKMDEKLTKRPQIRRSIGGIAGATYPKLQLQRLPSRIVGSASKKLQIRRQSAGVKAKIRRRGRPPTKHTRVRYVEREIVDHADEARKKKPTLDLQFWKELWGAEIKELVVPLSRLEGPTLLRYLEKRAAEPVTTFQSEGSVEAGKKFGGRKRRRRANYNNVGNLKGWRTQRPKKKFAKSEKSTSDKSTSDKSLSDKSTSEKSTSDKSVRNKSTSNKSTSEKSAKRDSANEDSDRLADSASALRSIDSDSDENSDDSGVKYISIINANPRVVNEVIGVDWADGDSRSAERSVIRKLPSRSPIASVLSHRDEEEIEHRESPKKHVASENREKSGAESATDSIEEFDPEQFEEVARDENGVRDFEGAKDRQEIGANFSRQETTAKDRQEIGADFSPLETTAKKSAGRKTYLPSKRRVAKKSGRSCDEASREICMMCKQLFALMRQLAGQFVGDRANRISVKCPLCNLYFISMFFLKKHVANHHLQCQSERGCTAIAPIARSASDAASDAAIDCETEVALVVECQHCEAKFSTEKYLVDHVFAQHDLPIFTDPAEQNDLRRFAEDFESPSTSREVEIEENREIGEKSAESGDENREIGEKLAESVEDNREIGEKSGKARDSKDEKTADRENLLTQLLSDDSIDGPEAPESRDTRREPKSAEESTEQDQRFAGSKCDICRKEFSQSRDLLIHSLEHEAPEIRAIAPDSSQIGNTDLLADSPDYEWSRAALESSTVAPRADNLKTTATIYEPMSADREIGDDIFASGDESLDFSLTYRGDEDEKIDDASTSRATKRKAPISEKSAPEAAEPRSKRAKIMRQLLETEEGLANAEETGASGKLPIECGKCNRKFPNQEALNEHLFFLHDDSLKDTVLTDVVSSSSRPRDETAAPQQWRCDKCSHNFKLLQSYSRHRYFVHGDDEFVHVCENCCKVLTSVTTVNVHICTDVASYNCRTCNETFDTGLSLRLHNMYKHKETEGPHVCRPCDKRFLTNAMLKRHEKWKHRFLRPYRPRKRSPVRMASPREYSEKITENHESEDEMDSGCDQEYPEMEYEFTGREIGGGKRKLSDENFRRREEFRRDSREELAGNSREEFGGNPREEFAENSPEEFVKNSPEEFAENSPEEFVKSSPEEIVKNSRKRFARNSREKSAKKSQNRFAGNSQGEFAGNSQGEFAGNSQDEFAGNSQDELKKNSRLEFAGNSLDELKKNSRLEFSRNSRKKTRIPNRRVSSVCYVNESEVSQCDHCRLLCLSQSALLSHRASSHATISDVCRLCLKKFPRGRLARHMIDFHVNPCETREENSDESMWNFGGSVEEKDAEDLIEMLGTTRLISLCEYQRFAESTEEKKSVTCPSCEKTLDDREAYKFHFFEHHDAICALCNIEFKTGDQAAIHKIEDHGTIDSYVWFADRTIAALTAAANFQEVAERNFIEMISRESDEESREKEEKGSESDEESEDENCEAIENVEETRNETCEKNSEGLEERENRGEKGDGILEEEMRKIETERLVIVVNDEDIVKFGIGTETPNIWGLAAKISSTSEDLTPTDVKTMLESHFER